MNLWYSHPVSHSIRKILSCNIVPQEPESSFFAKRMHHSISPDIWDEPKLT